MNTRYLIGRAELLTYPIEAPKKKPGSKAHPYTFSDARQVLLPAIESANTVFQTLPAKACVDDLAVASLVLHPAYLAKSFFPKLLLDQVGLSSVGSRTRRIKPRHQVRHGFVIMLLVSVVNVALNLVFEPHVAWAMLPIAVFAFGWALMVPVVTIKVLDLAPDRRGMASSLQACIGSAANGLVAGVLVPLVMRLPSGSGTGAAAQHSQSLLTQGHTQLHTCGQRGPQQGQRLMDRLLEINESRRA